MPVLIAAVVISFLSGVLLRDRRTSMAIACVLGLVGIVALVWAVADDKGDDPWWLIPIGVAGAAINVGAAVTGKRLRTRRFPADSTDPVR